MFPATFVPYIIKLIAPELTEKIANHIAKAFKLPQLVNYMELPNDADQKIIVQEKKLEKQGKELILLREMVIDLGKDSHPEKPFEDRISKLEAFEKKVRNKKVFKSINAK